MNMGIKFSPRFRSSNELVIGGKIVFSLLRIAVASNLESIELVHEWTDRFGFSSKNT